jgi:hypothetical protein
MYLLKGTALSALSTVLMTVSENLFLKGLPGRF